jgi:hypothetical protein
MVVNQLYAKDFRRWEGCRYRDGEVWSLRRSIDGFFDLLKIMLGF